MPNGAIPPRARPWTGFPATVIPSILNSAIVHLFLYVPQNTKRVSSPSLVPLTCQPDPHPADAETNKGRRPPIRLPRCYVFCQFNSATEIVSADTLTVTFTFVTRSKPISFPMPSIVTVEFSASGTENVPLAFRGNS